MKWPILVAIAVLAMWTRVQYIDLYGGRTEGYNTWASEHYFGGISSFYLSTSDELAAGGAYTEMHHPPGYSYLLAAFKILGIRSIGGIRIAQSAIDVLIVVVVYYLARSLRVSEGWSLVASGLYAVWPLFASGATWPLAESLSPAFVAIALSLFLCVPRAGPAGGFAAAAGGLVVGAAALVRPELVLLIVPAAAWIAISAGPQRMRMIAIALAACAVPVAGWGLHNRTTNGVWMFGSTSSGIGLWEGLGEQPNGYGYAMDDSAANHVLMPRGLKWGSVEADEYLRREYLNAWREHPGFVMRVIAARIPKILFESEHLQPLVLGRARQIVDAVGALLVALAVWVHRRNQAAWLLLLLPPLYAVASIGLVHYEPRYVRYVQLSYLLAAVVIADDLWARVVRPRPRLLVPATIVLAAVSLAYVGRELHALHVVAVAAR